MSQVPLVPINPPEISKFRDINNVPFGNGNLKINIIIIWLLLIPFPFRTGIISNHPKIRAELYQ